MTSTCFICKNMCEQILCLKCDKHCHKQCWKNVIFSFDLYTTNKVYSGHMTGSCPDCFGQIYRAGPVTRSMMKREYISSNPTERKDYLVSVVKGYLEHASHLYGQDLKKKITERMFNFILVHKKYLEGFFNFMYTARAKLIEFHIEHSDWEFPAEMYEKLFNEKIPHSNPEKSI